MQYFAQYFKSRRRAIIPENTHGGKREGAGRPLNTEKGLPMGRSIVACVKVEAEIKEWLKANGGAALHYEILKAAYDNAKRDS